MLKRTTALILLAFFLGMCATPQSANAKSWPAEDTADASGNTVWSRSADNDQADPGRSDGARNDAHQPPNPSTRTTPPEPCAGHQIINGRNKCDHVVAKEKADKPPTKAQLRSVIALLHLPDPTPRLGPDPSVNEWNMLAVGYPIWLWTDQPNHLTTTAKKDGLIITLNATRTHTTFTLGDGTTKTCTTTTPYPGYTPNPSPTCSYTYEVPSPIGHPYTLTATNHWTINWTTPTHHGTLTHTTTGTRTLDVGQLQSLIIG